jgi:enamine deaminase RidA (YjgF/YER057c/UK114 family)
MTERTIVMAEKAPRSTSPLSSVRKAGDDLFVSGSVGMNRTTGEPRGRRMLVRSGSESYGLYD